MIIKWKLDIYTKIDRKVTWFVYFLFFFFLIKYNFMNLKSLSVILNQVTLPFALVYQTFNINTYKSLIVRKRSRLCEILMSRVLHCRYHCARANAALALVNRITSPRRISEAIDGISAVLINLRVIRLRVLSMRLCVTLRSALQQQLFRIVKQWITLLCISHTCVHTCLRYLCPKKCQILY